MFRCIFTLFFSFWVVLLTLPSSRIFAATCLQLSPDEVRALERQAAAASSSVAGAGAAGAAGGGGWLGWLSGAAAAAVAAPAAAVAAPTAAGGGGGGVAAAAGGAHFSVLPPTPAARGPLAARPPAPATPHIAASHATE